MDKSLSGLSSEAFGVGDPEDVEFSEHPLSKAERMDRGADAEQALREEMAETQAILDMTDGDIDEAHDKKVARLKEDVARQKQLRPYTDGLPFDLARIQHEILSRTERMQKELVEIGLYLIWAREELRTKRDEEDTTFQQWIWDNLSFSPRRAYEYIAIADKMVQLGGLKSASGRTFLRLTSGSKSKMLGLLDLSEEELEDVRSTGSFLGRNLDAVDKMGWRQLKAEFRKERELADAKQTQIDELQVKLKKANEKLKPKPGAPQTMHELKTGDPEFGRVMEAVGLYWKWADATFDVIEPDKEQRNRREMWLRGLKSKVEEVAGAMCPWLVFGLSPIEQEEACEGGEETGEDET